MYTVSIFGFKHIVEKVVPLLHRVIESLQLTYKSRTSMEDAVIDKKNMFMLW